MLGFTSLGRLPNQTSTASILSSASFAVSEAPDVAAFITTQANFVILSATEAPDVASVNLRISLISLLASEAPDIASVYSEITSTASMSVVEAADGVSLPLIVLWTQVSDPSADVWATVSDGFPYNQTVNY